MTLRSEFEDEDRDDELEEQDPFDFDSESVRVFSVDDDDEVDLDAETIAMIPVKPEIADVLSTLEQGKRHFADLYGFSDLSSSELALLGTRWPLIDDELRASVVREAIDIGQEDFSFQLLKFFLFTSHDENPRVRQLAVAALGHEALPMAAERLLDVVQDDVSDDVRGEAANSLGPFVMYAEWEELTPDLSARLRRTLYELAENEGESWHVRRLAAGAVSACGPNDRVNRLVQRMYDEDEIGLRATALYAAGRGNLLEWLPVVIEEMANDDAEIRCEAARSAGMFGDADAFPGLTVLARSEQDAEVRQTAIAAIGEIGGKGAIRILSRLTEVAPEADEEVIDDALSEASILLNDPLTDDANGN